MKRILSLALVSAMLMTGCAVPGSAAAGDASGPVLDSAPDDSEPVFLTHALAQPVYPEFPKQPVMPAEGTEGGWETYQEDYDRYMDALRAIRGESSHLTQEEHDSVNAFAAKSAPLVLSGRQGENAIYSPLSLWSALAVLAQCAGGDSRQQVLDALDAESLDSLQEMVSHLWRTLYTDDGISSLILADSIWISSEREGAYVQETLDVLAERYFAGSYAVPMGTEEADRAVTSWVDQQTNGLIGGEGPVVQTKAATLALLISSLYYRAAWMDPFDADRTEEDIFTSSTGQESRVDFMHKIEDTYFLRREGYQAARLRTRLGEMVFVLPDEGVGPASLLQEPDFFSRLEFYGDAAAWGEVRWSVPKFDVDSDLGLADTLAAMGVGDLLDPDRADLSALTDMDAFLSDAKQLARVKVDEEGVEAAAVTILDIATNSLPLPPQEVCIMDLDRPFLFIIRIQDVPLFIGIVDHM